MGVNLIQLYRTNGNIIHFKIMKFLLLNLSLFASLSIIATNYSFAQPNVRLYLQSGIITGTPMGSLSNIPEGATGSLGVGINSGFELKMAFHNRFSLNIGALFAKKSNEFLTPVEGKYNISDGILGIKLPFPINVNYKGMASGRFLNKYIDIPIHVGFQAGKRTMVSLGYQYSKLISGQLSGEADIKALALNFKDQKFDESHLIKTFDHAAIAGVHYQFVDNLEIRLRFGYGLNGIFSQSPEGMNNMRNLYLGTMLAYGFQL